MSTEPRAPARSMFSNDADYRAAIFRWQQHHTIWMEEQERNKEFKFALVAAFLIVSFIAGAIATVRTLLP